MSYTRPTPLSEIQNIFFDAIKSRSSNIFSHIVPIHNMSERACLEIYSRGYTARLTESLGETFAATWWVLGDTEFFKLTKEYIMQTPSTNYDLSTYGEKFSTFLSTKFVDIPFLGDLARFEWLFQEIFHKPNIIEGTSAFLQRLSASKMDLMLSPSCVLFQSPYSIYEIWGLRKQPIDSLAELEINRPQSVLLFKKSSKIMVQRLQNDECLTIEALIRTGDIAATIEILSEKHPQTDSQRIQSIFKLIAELNVLLTRVR